MVFGLSVGKLMLFLPAAKIPVLQAEYLVKLSEEMSVKKLNRKKTDCGQRYVQELEK